MSTQPTIGWDNMGLRAGPTWWEQRRADIINAMRNAQAGVVTLARDVWEFMGTPEWDRLAAQLPVIAPVLLMAGAAARNSNNLQRLAKLASEGNQTAIKFFKANIPIEKMEDMAGEFLRVLRHGKQAAERWLHRISTNANTNIDVYDVRNVDISSMGEAAIAEATRVAEAHGKGSVNPLRDMIEEAMESGGPERAAKIARSAVEHNVFRLMRDYIRRAESDRRWRVLQAAEEELSGRNRQLSLDDWIIRFKRMAISANIQNELTPYIPNRPLQMWLNAHRRPYQNYVYRYGSEMPTKEEAKVMLLDALEKWIKEHGVR